MAIKDIFKMIKADRYTSDGREELIKAQEAITEDIRYKPGDISKATGLQKYPDGSWAPVKNAPAQKKTDSKSDSGMSKHWVQKGDEADFVERTPEEEKKMWQGVASRQSDDKLMLAIKNREGRELKPVEKIKLEAAKEELAKRNASKVDSIKQSESKKWDDFFSEMDKKTGSAPSDLKIQGMSKEEYIPWRMKTYKENEAQASSMWNHFAEQQKNKGKENEYDPDFHPLRDSAPRILTGDCKVRIKKSK